MGRPRKYANDAERVRAFRARKKGLSEPTSPNKATMVGVNPKGEKVETKRNETFLTQEDYDYLCTRGIRLNVLHKLRTLVK